MTFSKSVSFLALSASLAASGAMADVSASDVWADWQGYLGSMGYTVDGTASQSGSVLTVDGARFVQSIVEDDSTVTMSMEFGELVFTENGDGTVTLRLNDTIPIVINATTEEGAPFAARVDMTQTAPVLIVSGDRGDLTYTYSAADLGMVLRELEAEGSTLSPGQVEFSAKIADVSAVTHMKTDPGRTYSQQLTATSMRYGLDMDIPGPEGVQGNFSGGLEGLSVTSAATIPENADPTNLSDIFANGGGGDGRLSYAAGNSSFDFTTPDGPSSGTSTTGATDMEFAFQPEGLAIDVTQKDLSMNMLAANLPLPIAITMEESGFNFRIPTQPSDDPQDIAFGLTLKGFTIPDMLWGMFDPAGQLPRDPITLVLDLTGQGIMALDVFDPDVAETMEAGPVNPGQLDSLTVNRLFLSALGATITGDGAFTFDNSDMQTFPGSPRPEGTFNVALEGLNTLMDTLVNMGLLPQDQAMAGRMMMGLFTVPDGDDRLKSTIEVNEQGHVLANGQRLR